MLLCSCVQLKSFVQCNGCVCVCVCAYLCKCKPLFYTRSHKFSFTHMKTVELSIPTTRKYYQTFLMFRYLDGFLTFESSRFAAHFDDSLRNKLRLLVEKFIVIDLTVSDTLIETQFWHCILSKWKRTLSIEWEAWIQSFDWDVQIDGTYFHVFLKIIFAEQIFPFTNGRYVTAILDIHWYSEYILDELETGERQNERADSTAKKRADKHKYI